MDFLGEADSTFWLWVYFCLASTQPGHFLTEAQDVTQRLAASLTMSIFHQLQATPDLARLGPPSWPPPLTHSLFPNLCKEAFLQL